MRIRKLLSMLGVPLLSLACSDGPSSPNTSRDWPVGLTIISEQTSIPLPSIDCWAKGDGPETVYLGVSDSRGRCGPALIFQSEEPSSIFVTLRPRNYELPVPYEAKSEFVSVTKTWIPEESREVYVARVTVRQGNPF